MNKKLNRENLTLALCIALFPPIWAVLSPKFGVEVGAVALICAGVYAAAGNRTELAVPMTLGFFAGDCWAVLALWMMELLPFGQSASVFVTLFVMGGAAVLISSLLPKVFYCPSWLCGWAIGLTEGELFGYAALKAMEDAGVNPQDVDFYFHGEASPLNGSNYLTPNIHVTNWFGMKGKASIHHSEACCTGYYAVEEAVNAVASGKHDCVLSGCVEFGDSLAVPNHPYKREKMTMDKFLQTTAWLYDRAYTRSLMAGQELIYDDAAEWYKRTRGITDEQMDDTLNWMCINNRRNASKNPLAIERKPYEELAKEAGFDNVMDYMRSPYNPKMGDFLRAGGLELKCDGAAAVVVCATELVDKYMGNKSHKPIEVLGIGCAACEATTPHFEVRATEEAIRQVYEVTGVKPEEIDIFYANDFIITSHLVAAEIAGYLPYGEGWKYICEGRTAYDGDKPINTNGGRTSFGHAHAASGLADLYEAVHQMRGEAGEGQVKKLPKTAMLRGYGGAQNICTYIIRTKD